MADSNKNNKIHINLVMWGLIFSFNLSLITLLFYIVDPDFPDKVLLFLLTILQYSSFFVCICSVYLLVTSVIRVIRRPHVLSFLSIVLFLCGALYGAGVILFKAFIVAIAHGNG